VKFTDETQVHEIPAASPPKPKRTRKAHPVEKRSVTVDLANLGPNLNGSEPDAKVETVDQGQRASMTSLEDLKKFDATKGTYNVPPKEKANLTQVKNSMSSSTYSSVSMLHMTSRLIFQVQRKCERELAHACNISNLKQRPQM
jgi:hypothetical protein